MSSIVVSGDVSGTCTLQAPATAGSTVLTLPTTSATLITDSSGILNIGSGQIYKDASGNVGIGTSSPSSLGKFVVLTAQADTADIAVFQRANTATFRIRSGGSGVTMVGSQYADSLAFETNATERMRIDSSGNVGIGTSSPAQKLEVSSASASTGNVNARVTNTQSAVSVDLAVTGSAYSYLNIPASGAYLYSTSSLSLVNSSANPITFITNSTERMRIDSAGRVTYSNNPAFITGSVAGGVTYTSGVKVNYSNNVYNRGSCWNSTNNYFVAPVAGYYFFKAQLWTNTGSAGAAYFRVNGSWRYGSFGNEATNIGFNGYAMVEMFYLAANDYVDVACRLGTVYTDSSFSTFSGYLIG